ncbi:hypothetical protein FRB91_007346 [Serendipita sp. 411]|nr:hypothetical protein FRB91_007346 [Serendipita sp. 411]
MFDVDATSRPLAIDFRTGCVVLDHKGLIQHILGLSQLLENGGEAGEGIKWIKLQHGTCLGDESRDDD